MLPMIVDMLFPKGCIGCGRWGIYICTPCETKLRYIEHELCFYCKKESPHGLTHTTCKKEGRLDGIMSIFYYDSILKEMIAAVKYELAVSVWDDFKLAIHPHGLYKLSFLRLFLKTAVYIPLPLHPKRRNMRGFNQAELITEFFRNYLHFPINHALVRKKNTPFQAKLSSDSKRRNNVRNAFAVSEPILIRNHNIILVDDVVTSGSTIQEVVTVCKQAGAQSIYGLTLARG